MADLKQGMLILINDARTKVAQKVHLSHEEILALHEKAGPKAKADVKPNNYHQARIGIALAALESVALMDKLSHFQANGRAWAELAGSLLSLSSITCDIVYASVKSMREIKPIMKSVGVDQAADIYRGGWKLGAGVLSVGAGVASICLDSLNLTNEYHGRRRGFLMALYSARIFVSGFSVSYGALAAFSYGGPTLSYVAKALESGSFANKGKISNFAVGRLSAAAKVAVRLAEARVHLLLQVARFNLIGLGLTAAELGYYGYMQFIADNALQKWCLQSTFRNRKTDTTLFGISKDTERYVGEQEELEALHAAREEVQGVSQ